MIRTYKITGAKVKYILLPNGFSLSMALKILGLDLDKVKAELVALG